MNEDQVTALLDRLANRVEVSSPPEQQVAGKGRKRLRRRRGAELVGVVAALSAMSIGGFALRLNPNPNMTSPSVATLSTTMPGRAPTKAELRGSWRPVWLSGFAIGLSSDPYPGQTLYFGNRPNGFGWQGTDGCTGWGGQVHLGEQGAFATSDNAHTRVRCQTAGTEVEAVLKAAYIRLAGGRLELYDRSHARLGVFVRFYPTEPPPGPNPIGTVPTEADLVGAWHPAELGQGPWAAVPNLYAGQWLVFDNRNGGLHWEGEDGCNSVSGQARVDSAGSFSTSGFASTLVACTGRAGKPRYTEVDAILHANQVRLVGKGLAFYDGATRIGLFVRGSQPHCCPSTTR
jgi:hypothetical protein